MEWLPLTMLAQKDTPVSVGASATNEVVTKTVATTASGSLHSRVTFIIGEVTDTDDSSTVGVQHSNGFGIWDSTKTGDVGATKTANNFTAATTDICTDSSHGLSSGDAIVVNTSDTLPAGLETKTIYYVEKINDNTFYLHSGASLTSNTRVDITDTGTGTHSWYTVTEVDITFNVEVAGDQSYTPLKQRLRGVCTTGAGDAVDILDVVLTQGR